MKKKKSYAPMKRAKQTTTSFYQQGGAVYDPNDEALYFTDDDNEDDNRYPFMKYGGELSFYQGGGAITPITDPSMLFNETGTLVPNDGRYIRNAPPNYPAEVQLPSFSDWYRQQVASGKPGDVANYGDKRILLDPRDFGQAPASATTRQNQQSAGRPAQQSGAPVPVKKYKTKGGGDATRYSDGKVVVEYPDGGMQTVWPDGQKTQNYPNGRTVIQMPDGETMRYTEGDWDKSLKTTRPSYVQPPWDPVSSNRAPIAFGNPQAMAAAAKNRKPVFTDAANDYNSSQNNGRVAPMSFGHGQMPAINSYGNTTGDLTPQTSSDPKWYEPLASISRGAEVVDSYLGDNPVGNTLSFINNLAVSPFRSARELSYDIQPDAEGNNNLGAHSLLDIVDAYGPAVGPLIGRGISAARGIGSLTPVVDRALAPVRKIAQKAYTSARAPVEAAVKSALRGPVNAADAAAAQALYHASPMATLDDVIRAAEAEAKRLPSKGALRNKLWNAQIPFKRGGFVPLRRRNY